MITIGFIRGLKFGLEYVELDDDDRDVMGVDSGLLTSLDLGFFRIMLFHGNPD